MEKTKICKFPTDLWSIVRQYGRNAGDILKFLNLSLSRLNKKYQLRIICYMKA